MAAALGPPAVPRRIAGLAQLAPQRPQRQGETRPRYRLPIDCPQPGSPRTGVLWSGPA